MTPHDHQITQATRRLVLDAQLRKKMGAAARDFSWKFERNIILQQMAENYKVRCVHFHMMHAWYSAGAQYF